MKMVKVGEISQIESFRSVNEDGKGYRREVEIKSPLYINVDNVIWVEPTPTFGSKIYFNTSRGSAGTACVIVDDVLVEDMLDIINGKSTYEDVKIDCKSKRYSVMMSRNQTKILKEVSIPVMG